MFNTTHDAILLILAVIYILTALVRTILIAGLPAHQRPSHLNVSIPLLLALALAITAVLW